MLLPSLPPGGGGDEVAVGAGEDEVEDMDLGRDVGDTCFGCYVLQKHFTYILVSCVFSTGASLQLCGELRLAAPFIRILAACLVLSMVAAIVNRAVKGSFPPLWLRQNVPYSIRTQQSPVVPSGYAG